MYNLRLIGGRLDHINLRISFAVIGIFAIVTIVSYFYELSRAGLLTRHAQYHPRFPHLHREARDIDQAEPGPGSRHPLHQLGSQIDSIKNQLHMRKKGEEPREINFAVHLGKNDSYAKVVNTSFQAFQHQNTQPNFYTQSCLVDVNASPSACMKNLTSKVLSYNNATQVLVYQHEPGGYFMRDCLKFVAQKAGKVVGDMPLNSVKREEWEHLGIAKKKSSMTVLYGGLAFGVCETISRPCLYMTLLSHPITRILTLYDICSRNRSSTYCKINGLNHSNVTLDHFIRSQRSNLFYKLLYNHRHCKLVGQDEICLPDSGTSFLLSQNEKKAYLDDIVANLEEWFGLIGLVDYLPESLKMFETALGLKFSKCLDQAELIGRLYKTNVAITNEESDDKHFMKDYLRVSENMEYMALKEDLESDVEVRQILHADLVIYEKLEEIFKKQLKSYGLYERLLQSKDSWDWNRQTEEEMKEAVADRHFSRKITEYSSVEITRNAIVRTQSTNIQQAISSPRTNCTKVDGNRSKSNNPCDDSNVAVGNKKPTTVVDEDRSVVTATRNGANQLSKSLSNVVMDIVKEFVLNETNTVPSR